MVIGWKRDLTREGIEPNPGPTTFFVDVVNYLKNRLGKYFSVAQPTLEQLDMILSQQYSKTLGSTLDELEHFISNNTDEYKTIVGSELADQLENAIIDLKTKSGIFINFRSLQQFATFSLAVFHSPFLRINELSATNFSWIVRAFFILKFYNQILLEFLQLHS
jgi:hypothetical protein